MNIDDSKGPTADVQLMPVPRVPTEGGGPEEELQTELRMARELLAAREARTKNGKPLSPPQEMLVHPRHTRLDESQLRDLIDRLERDLADVQQGFQSEEYSQLNGHLDYVEGER